MGNFRLLDAKAIRAGSFVGVETEQLCRLTGSVRRDDVELLDADGGLVFRSVL